VDIIENGVTGFLDADLGKAALAALALKPEVCRATALQYTWEACTRQFIANLNPLVRLPTPAAAGDQHTVESR
jgi:hypothetical protein